jgi:hypothetical protein
MRLQVEVTSGQAGQIPVLGEFAAGETKVIDAETLERFEACMGHKLAAGSFSGGSKCVVTILPDEVVEEKDDEKKGEEA